jgi:D-alanyl-D-alanine carboxypeptidase/D-alanyl-D-alanine-endopeptidase (penicillin-binding protein 4)
MRGVAWLVAVCLPLFVVLPLVAEQPAEEPSPKITVPAPERPSGEAPKPKALPGSRRAVEKLPVADEAAAKELRADLTKILGESGLSKTVTAARVLSIPEKGGPGAARILLSLKAEEPLVPASTMKLLTTAACLDRLGLDWQIRTHIGRLPTGNKDTPWDLVVIGGGDPNFSGRFYDGDAVGVFRKWAEVLKHRGVTAVGSLLVDDTLFDDMYVHPNWPANQRDDWYEAPVGALNLNDNCLEVHVAPGPKAGEPAKVWLVPEGPYASVTCTLTTTPERGRFTLAREVLGPADWPAEKGGPPGPMMNIAASGRIGVKASENVEYRCVADPTMFFGVTLAETLRKEGIAVAGPVVRRRVCDKDGLAPQEFVCDIVHTSRLDVTAAVANKRSQGLYAECMAKLLGAYGPTPKVEAQLPPRQGSWKAGTDEVLRWLNDVAINAEGCILDDGSGLSKQNRLTAACVADVLRVMYERRGPAFLETLAAAGRDGSLRNRMKGTAAEGNVYGKTGYVYGVSALSGYVKTRSGGILVYSILMNGFPMGELWKARVAQDKACVRMTEY